VGKVAIATLVMRNKEYLVAIRPEADALALHTMYFADEVRTPGRDLELPEDADVSARELSMAQLLIESMESEWDPARYHDTYREKVEALIEEKRSGHEIVIQALPEAPAKVVDLMEALNASIAAAAKSGSGGAAGDEARPAAPTRRASSAAKPAKKQAKSSKPATAAKVTKVAKEPGARAGTKAASKPAKPAAKAPARRKAS